MLARQEIIALNWTEKDIQCKVNVLMWCLYVCYTYINKIKQPINEESVIQKTWKSNVMAE